MDVSIAEAESRLAELIRAVEGGEQVVITDEGKPVAQITPPPPAEPERKKPRFDTMKGQIHLKPGWDDPIDEDRRPRETR
jgi:prevent-host-death family protein